MDVNIIATLTITFLAVILFATEKIRMDAVAIIVLVLLVITHQVSVDEAIAGFSNSATITVAAMFVLATGLQKSGALDGIGALLGKAKSAWIFLLILLMITSVISPFVNNTAVVAVFIPIVISACQQIKLSPSKALIPLSFVSQMAGVSTLIGTSTNLLVNSIAIQQGHKGFGMFDFTPMGVIFLVVGGVYLLFISKWLLPDTHAKIEDELGFGKYVVELKILASSPLINKLADDEKLNENFNVYILGLLRNGEKLSTPSHQELQENDILLVRGEVEDILKLVAKYELAHSSGYQDLNPQDKQHQLRIAEVMIAPNSKWIGTNVSLLMRVWNKDCRVWGIQRRGNVVRERLRDISLRVGDILLLTLPEIDISDLRQDNHFILLSEGSVRQGKSWRAKFALCVMGAVVLLAALNIVPIVITSLIGAVAMVMVGCLSAEDAYDSIDWRIIIVLAGLLPLGQAMANSGAAQFIVDNTLGKVQGFGPLVVLIILYLMTMILTEFMSNAGTAVLLTPIAVSTAKVLGVDASPFIVAVAFAAATSFMTPVGYQTNTMVYGAGGYRFIDFLKVGLPLNLIYLVLGAILIPIFWPFTT